MISLLPADICDLTKVLFSLWSALCKPLCNGCVEDAVLNDDEYAFPADELNQEYQNLRDPVEQSHG